MNTRLLRLSALVALATSFSTTVAYAQIAQVLPQQIRGAIRDALGRPLSDAKVDLSDAVGHTVATTTSDKQGQFVFPGVKPGNYAVNVDKPSFASEKKTVTVAENSVNPLVAVTLTNAETLDQIVVTSERLDRARNGISVETGSSIYRIGAKDIAALPQGESTPFNEVLLRAPGVAQDSHGQLHVRGDHANLQYRLNGILLPESISGFGQTLDTRFVDSVNLLTGALPAQYGYRTAGVVDIHTKTGQVANGGNIGVEFGSNNARQISGDVSGSHDGFSYYINGSFDANNLGIENPTGTSTALHDRTLQNKAFSYFSYLLNPDTRVSLILGTSDGRFQIPNIAGKTPSFQLDGVTNYPSAGLNERQRETNRYGILAVQGVIGNDIDYQVAAFSRYTKVLFEPDMVGDLLYTGVASRVLRTGLANGLQTDGSYRLNDTHTIRAGVSYTRESLKNSNDSLTFTADTNGNQTSMQPFSINDQGQKTTNQTGIYLQDEWKLNDQFTVNYGARMDWLNAYVSASQFSPRVGVVYQMTPRTTFHAGYAKYFTPPTSELIAATTVGSFNGTTNAAATSRNDPVQAESADYFDLGVVHQLTPHLTIGLDGYYKKVKSMLDEGQFGSALLFTPFNYAQGKVYGLELTVNYRNDNLGAYLNIARSTALGKTITSSQYNFGQSSLDYIASHWVHLDHDQSVTASTGVSYLWQGTTYSADALFGSGLRSGFANTQHLPSYTEVNMGVSHTFNASAIGKVTARLSMINVFDRVYQIRDGSGIGVGAPQFGQRRGMYVAMSTAF
ncbi:TonB-dependent receptor [Glaciimonas immobilis]|uniref:Outer membrane receptor protein involved in Fe transport n=1 Tax=Glaciimonas immobilis TaxID=728004 RepID=A0A840RRH6_9BURK|nr:TonB-dependent receptor [Glaciimonas immobilis]KAF3998101.1 TonB-dependent receptor [Glaciimonas immobilis]MBB5199201.1 outer membrane receptor protein involved in Fe transport [Glaciimonas immobilis]